MITSNEHITSFNWASPEALDAGRRKLLVEFDESTVTILINNAYKPPISWFLTDEHGEMILMGQIAESHYKVDLRELPKGCYSLRIAGEIHHILAE